MAESIMRDWAVGGGIITSGDSLLMVNNRRRDGKTDWTTPGGVIDAGETVIEGLTREVTEETGLVVASWQGPVYTVSAEAPDMGWTLTVEVYKSQAHEGDLVIDDPDGIVIDARWVRSHEIDALLVGHQRWFAEPLQRYLDDQPLGALSAVESHTRTTAQPCQQFCYMIHGINREDMHVEKLK